MRHAMVLALVATVGCATAPVPRQIERSVSIPGSTFDRVWDSVIDLFGERTWAIDNLERASGLITTDWMLTGEMSESYMDCGRPGGFDVDSDHQVRFNVVVRETDNGATLTVNTSMRAFRAPLGGGVTSVVSCVSTGVLEREVHDEIELRAG